MMKTKAILWFGTLVLSTSIAFGQWTQLGLDIDGVTPGDHSGYSVSINTDGSRVAIGSYGYGGSSGHVRIFEWQESNWIQLGTDIIGEIPGDFSGVAVSINGDGSRVAIGATGNDGNGMDSGHARVYEWQGGNWIQLGSDIDGEAAGDQSGVAISLSTDGSRLAIGAYLNDDNGFDSGHARVYEWQGGNWVQLGADMNGEAANDWFGYSVNLSGDGNRLVVGGIGNDGNGDNSGHARVYEWQMGNWVQLGPDFDGEAANDSSGSSVSISENGNRVAIGANGNDGNVNGAGHVRIYEWQGASWTQMGLDINGENFVDGSGRSVSLSNDGSRIAIGAPGSNTNFLTDSGNTRVFEWQVDSWGELRPDMDGEAEEDGSGVSVSLSGDGSRIAVGADFNDGGGADSGHVRVFRFQPPNTPLGVGSGSSSNGEGNVFIGSHSGFNNTDGNNNTYLGESSGYNNQSGSGNVFLGNRAGYNETGSNLLYIDNSTTDTPLIYGDFENDSLQINGTLSIANLLQDDGLSRILVADNNGNISWRSDSSLDGGVATFASYPESAGDNGDNTSAYFGHEAGLSSTGIHNTFIGHQSGYSNTTGYENSSLGSLSLRANTSGVRNTANGIAALYSNLTGNENTGIGYSALGFNTFGYGNTASGVRALLSNSNGTYNTAIGYEALTANTTGSGNVAMGYMAGPAAGDTGLQNTTAIGYQASVSGDNAIAIGNGAVVNAANGVRIGNGDIISIGGAVAWSVVSDGRFKKAVQENVPGLEFIEKLRPVSYELDRGKLNTFLKGSKTHNSPKTQSSPSRRTTGFVAQEVADLLKEHNYTFSGVEQPQNDQDHYSIRYSEFVVPLTKAVQELSALVTSQQQEIETLKNLVYGSEIKLPGNTDTKGKNIVIEGFALQQNMPNPFHQTTTISAMIPETVQQARIIVYNLQGLELERYDINNRGSVAVEISGGRFPSGMYLYALIADGQLIDTKRMILTK